MSGIWCRKFCDPTIWKNRTKIINAFEQNVSRIKRFRTTERSDVNGALRKWFKQEIMGGFEVSGPLLTVIFVFPKFKFPVHIFQLEPG